MINFSYDAKKQLGVLKGDLVEEIRENFSVKNEAAFFMRRYGRFAPQRTYTITPTGKFEPGLYFEIYKYLKQTEYKDPIETDNEFLDIIMPSRKWQSSHKFTKDIVPLALPLRDYQEEIVKKAYSIGRGTIVLATAGGKTLTAASLLTKLFVLHGSLFKCLYIVPDLGLVEQTSADFVSYNVPFTVRKWTGSHALETDTLFPANVVVANLGILQSKNTDLSWIEDIDVLIVDEVHKIRRGNEVNKILKKIKTPCRFGFTGTMPEGMLDQWNIIGKIGPVIYEKSSYELRLEKYISGVAVQIIELEYSPDDRPRQVDNINKYREEVTFLMRNKFRNDVISKLTCKLNNNALVLVDYIEHGELLTAAIKEVCPSKKIYFIRGEVEVEERDKVRKLMEECNDVVVIAISKIFSTGINIKNLHYIVFACGGKAKVKIIQSVGRGLRLHINKDKLIIFDINDNLHYSRLHSEKRLKLYEKENIQTSSKKITQA